MKSNQERSNECLPPKKREILALEERAAVVVAAAASESQRGENLAWLASVATMASVARGHSNGAPPPLAQSHAAEPDSPSPSHGKPLSVVTEYHPCHSSSSVSRGVLQGAAMTPHPAILSSSPAGTIQYAQLPPSLQFIGPYTGYISSQVVTSQRPGQEGYAVVSQATNGGEPQGQCRATGVASPLPNSAQHPAGQCIQIESGPLGVTVASPLHLHPHQAVLAAPHGLALGPSQVLLHYADGLVAKLPDRQVREVVQNGELGPTGGVARRGGEVRGACGQQESEQRQQQQQQRSLGFQSRTQVLLPADYATQDRSGLQASLMLVPNCHPAISSSAELTKDPSSLPPRGGLSLGRAVSSRVSSESLVSPHAILHTSHRAVQELSASLYSAAQLPIIGYIASSGGGTHQPALAGYHSNLPQHLVISSSPSVLIPVSAGNGSEADPRCAVASVPPPPPAVAAMPQAYVTTCAAPHKAEDVMATTPVQLVPSPAVPMPAPTQTPPASPSAALPPYFMKGSIIQLADGELKRVEDLSTDDFLQSAAASGELKIDSSTVERIDCSPTPDAVLIQFSVGEHRAQVCVEVLVEYPFFVFGQGWSSCCPDRTTQLLELTCTKLSVGDVCISLTLRSLSNGSVPRREQTPEDHCNLHHDLHHDLHLKPSKPNGPLQERPAHGEELASGQGQRPRPGGGVGAGGVGDRGATNVQTFPENGEVRSRAKEACMPPPPEKNQHGSTERPVGRKRRWSAPERGEAERPHEEPPSTLPKLSFIPQEVKLSIEGRSNTGR